MSVFDTPLFPLTMPESRGIGFHNIGTGVLRASHAATIAKVETHYGERCGHIPLTADRVSLLVNTHTDNLHSHVHYLSALFGKEIQPVTVAELTMEQRRTPAVQTLIVPYVNVPEAETLIQTTLQAQTWGLPAAMVDILKNKARFYQLLDELALEDLHAPDYRIAALSALPATALQFLQSIEELLKAADVPEYPRGIMVRAAESDGNYGSCLLYEQRRIVHVIYDGDAAHVHTYPSWQEALAASQKHLYTTMDVQKEERVVISRYLDMLDSPGLSVVILDGQVESLRWNGQLQKEGSKACVGTSTFRPKTAQVARLQREYEDRMAERFETLLRLTALRCGIDFASIRGVANIDIMLPGPLEERLQQRLGYAPTHYIAESNPRWTNYTDAILAVIGANRQIPTVQRMRQVIQSGVLAVDKYELPQGLDPRMVRSAIAARDDVLKQQGTRIICRMAQSPMGVIFAGDVEMAQQELATIVHTLANRETPVSLS